MILTLDHLIPRSKGGKSSWTNLVTACKKCNSKKGDFRPEKVGMKLNKPCLSNPLTFRSSKLQMDRLQGRLETILKS